MYCFRANVVVALISSVFVMAIEPLQMKSERVFVPQTYVNEFSEEANADTLIALNEKYNLSIHFATGTSVLDEYSKNELSKFAEYLNRNRKVNIAIVGHTDNVSQIAINQKISEDRAQSVANYLISIKVNANQLKKIAGKNFKEPLGDNATEKGRALNRRVELVFLTQQEAEMAKSNWSNKSTEKVDTLQRKPVPAVFKKLLTQIIEHKENTKEIEIELDGLLVDDTKTKSGKDFYDLFYCNWEPPPNAKNYSIVISEKPYRLTTTMITISINESLVHQIVLQPRQDIIEMQVEEAIYILQDYLSNYEEIMKQLNGDDRSGSGIY